MKHSMKKTLALVLSILLVITMFPTVAFAGTTKNVARIDSRVNGYIPFERHGSSAVSDAYVRGDMAAYRSLSGHTSTRATIPSSYDSRNYGYITSVKNQNPYGTCWTFGTMAPIEAYMIKHGIINNDTGAAATSSMDLSEYHLAWFNYTNAYDKLGMLTGDSTKPVGSTFLDLGGNGAMATFTMMRWTGPASEATSALKYSNASTSGLNSQYAYNYNVSHVTDVTWIPTANRNAVKEAIMEYGAATISYHHADTYLNSSTGAYCFKQSAAYGSNNYQYANHAVTVVGWDDNYSKSNFKSSYGPSSNGAWIIKNSWGTSWGKNGYFYLSYEDTASLNDTCYFYKVANLDNYANCYQYDGTSNFVNYQSMGNNCQIANIFTAKGTQSLQAVALSPWDEATTYTLYVYKGLTSDTNPTSGTLAATQTGYLPYSGYFTIPLDQSVSLTNGEKFSIVFKLSTPQPDPDENNTYVHIPYDATSETSWTKWTHANHGNTSYYKEANGSWTNVPNNGDFRIKAYTNDAGYTVTAVSNNTSYGTVSVNGNKITATPKSGYYVSDAQVTSGTATCTINGNVITVNASSNCTVKVIFSVKPQLTVNFKACGASVGSQTAYINDSITLPTTATAVNGYSFVGWTDAQVSETTYKPNYYAPGSTYTVTGNATLYALYTRTEGSSEVIYEIVTEPITDWTGNYVITSGKDSSMYVLKGLSGNTSYQSAYAGGTVTFASSGMTLDNGVLKNVGSAYVFQAEATGTGYSLKNASTGTYLGSYNSNLYGLSSYYSSYCVWGLEYDTYNICMKVSNYASSSYPYMVKGSNAYFAMNSGYTTNKTQLWKQTTASTTYYNTNPSATSPNVYYTVTFSVPDGVSAISPMTVEAGSTITLPTAGAPSGYTFLGWVASTVSDATVQPTTYSGAVTVNSSVTVYALYSYTEGGTGAVTYNLVSSAPSDWSGNYVITYGSSPSYVLTGMTPSSNGASIESTSNRTAYSSTGMSLSSSKLSNVADKYVFTVASTGSYYTIRSKTTGTYLGMTSGSYLAGYTSYNSSYCRWTMGVGSSASSAKNAANGSYPYLDFNTSSAYFWSNSTANTNIRWWKQSASGTTYYTTVITAQTDPDPVTPDPEPTTYYTVTFSVPYGVSAISPMTVEAGGTITLPTAGAPSGYTFLGWVTSTVSNATEQPTTYSGAVTVNGSVTLYALYSYTTGSGTGETAYVFQGSAPSNWEGNYVITCGTSLSSLYVLMGLSGNKSYQSTSAGGSVPYSYTGMTYANGYLTGVSSAYVWKVSATGSYYTLQNAYTGAYLGNYSNYLYSLSTYSSNYCRWTLSMDSSGNTTVKSTRSTWYPYLSLSSSKYFMVGSSVPTGLYFWKETTTGGSGTTYFTTG